ncbi:MAG: molecular chaperone TorD family protein [Rhodospirillales bacterium]|nr:molecular chaperone TorD family protein [Rhodospirillales bacterium]
MRNAPNSVVPMDLVDADRAVIYRLFSDLFARELRAEVITGLAELADVPAAAWATEPGLQPVFEQIRAMADDPEAASKDLAGVFAYLFLGAGGPYSAPPYESVYVGERGRVCREPVAAMERQLANMDLHVLQEFPEPADHVAVELAIAAALVEAVAPPAQLTEFLENRLNRWLGDFAATCARYDRHGFYATTARAAAEYVAADLERLQTQNLCAGNVGGK